MYLLDLDVAASCAVGSRLLKGVLNQAWKGSLSQCATVYLQLEYQPLVPNIPEGLPGGSRSDLSALAAKELPVLQAVVVVTHSTPSHSLAEISLKAELAKVVERLDTQRCHGLSPSGSLSLP